METQPKTSKSFFHKRLFANSLLRKRYFFALCMILLMVGIAGVLGEKEIIFPEMAALTIGMWIVDKRVWRVKRWQMVVMMTAGAVAGVCIVRYSSLPQLANLCMAFVFAAVCLLSTRTTLIPLISACMLPVLLGTESWVYPLAVCVMSLIIVTGQKLMEMFRVRNKIVFEPKEEGWKEEVGKWTGVLCSILVLAALAIYTANYYFIIPPLIVAYVEFVSSKAGFRNRPVQIVLLLVTASAIGTLFQIVGHYYFHLPEWVVALCVFIVLFTVFEWIGKFFAPVGALALIPMIVPEEGLAWMPLQVAVGATLFIAMGLVFFQQCYKWPRAQLVYCLTPEYLRNRLHNKKES